MRNQSYRNPLTNVSQQKIKIFRQHPTNCLLYKIQVLNQEIPKILWRFFIACYKIATLKMNKWRCIIVLKFIIWEIISYFIYTLPVYYKNKTLSHSLQQIIFFIFSLIQRKSCRIIKIVCSFPFFLSIWL